MRGPYTDTHQHGQRFVTRGVLCVSTSCALSMLMSVSMMLVCCEKVLTDNIGVGALGMWPSVCDCDVRLAANCEW